MLGTLWHDVRLAGRSLARARGFTVAALLTLALGIGLTTAVYSVVDAVLVQPVPFADSERLVVLWETDRDTGTTREPGSFPDFLDFRERTKALGDLAGFIAAEVNMTPEIGDPVRLPSLQVTDRFFPLIGVPPIAGRHLTSADMAAGAPDVALISESLWAALYQRRPAVIGQTIRLNSRPHTIVGVVPLDAGFGLAQILSAAAYSRGFVDRDRGAQVDVWRPLRATVDTLPRETHPLLMLGRLAPGSTRDSAQQELARIAADLERAHPSNQARGAFVEPFEAVVIGPVRQTLLVLLAAVVFLLLIACVNVANLLLARATSRVREIALRSAIGASTRQLARQFMVESALLTAAGAAAGLWLAFAALRVLLALAPTGIPRLAEVRVDFSVSLAIAAALGLLPLLHARRRDLQAALRSEDARAGSGDRGARIRRSGLVAAEVALAVALVTAAGLLLRTIGQLQQVDPGFDPTNVTKAEFQLPPTRYPIDFRTFPNVPAIHSFNERLLERVGALPGVEAAGLAGNQPLDVGFTNSFFIVGREAEAESWPEISVRRVTPGYFDTLMVNAVAGRLFDDRDTPAAAPVALINQAAAERFFGHQDPLGHQIGLYGANRRIVGVVDNEKIHGIATAAPIAVYTPVTQTPVNGTEALVVRSSRDLAAEIRAVFRDLDPQLAVVGIEPLDRTLANSIREQRFLMQLLTVFAAIALMLAAIGIHGVLSYTLAQRTREIGVRVALGATARDVMGLVIGQTVRVTFVGLVAGVALGLALAYSLRAWLFGVSPADPLTFGGVFAVLGCVAFASSYFPTRRATRIDPVVALRAE